MSFQAYVKGLLNLKKPQTDPIVLVDEPFDWPQLFIYSKDDELVRVEVIIISLIQRNCVSKISDANFIFLMDHTKNFQIFFSLGQ